MDKDCIRFLQWALPQLRMRWPGFKKVRKQVCKRIKRRLRVLALNDFAAYRNFLKNNSSEWFLLDEMCRITISRFYRDWAVFDAIKNNLLPELAENAILQKRPLRCWSAGCASGEEPYTIALIYEYFLQNKFPKLNFEIIATDADHHMLDRAKKGCYPAGSLKGLPDEWRQKAFFKKEDFFCLHPELGRKIKWLQQDIRKEVPDSNFDIILCRNLVATYFETSLQNEIFNRLLQKLNSGGFLVLGSHEKLPAGLGGIKAYALNQYIFQKKSNSD